MKIITGNRGCGVTTDLLVEAMAHGGGVYICATRKRAEFVNKKYVDIVTNRYKDCISDIPPIHFLTLNDIVDGYARRFDFINEYPIYIDDFGDCLEVFLSNYGLSGNIVSIGATW